ncbi:helix-turn-helix domain-containing protein [Paenibacillus rhizoplanae]
MEYVTQQRIEAAKFMLSSSDKSITVISSGVGYQERRYFTKVFLKQTGMTPQGIPQQVPDGRRPSLAGCRP